MKTAKTLRNLSEGLHRFDTGLYVRVSGGGASWLFKYQFKGRRREIGLGSTSEVTITAAKGKAAACRAMIASGVDPIASRREESEIREEKEEHRSKSGITFGEFYQSAIDRIQYLRQWTSAKHADQWRTTVSCYALPVLGDIPLKDVTLSHVLAVLEPIWSSKLETATRLRERLSIIFDYALSQGLMKANPAVWRGLLEYHLPPPSKVKQEEKHHAAVDAASLSLIARKLDRADCLTAHAVLLCMLTACRASEISEAKWSEVDFARATLTIPVERRKDRKPHPFVVPLSKQAIECLRRVPRWHDHIFAGDSGFPIHSSYLAVYLKKFSKRPITMHGCRSTFSDWCARTCKNFLVSEKCLMHAVGGKVFMAYQRDDLLDKRRELLQEWADYLLPPVQSVLSR